jgi:hypothetical protein
MPGQRNDVVFGLPALGYKDSVAPEFVEPGKLRDGSLNVLYNPRTKAWYRRGGTFGWEGTAAGVGLLETKHSFHCRRAAEIPLRSFALSQGVASLWSRDDTGFGCLHYANDDSISSVLGMHGADYDSEAVVNDISVGRGKTSAQRASLCVGSADFRAVHGYLHLPNYESSPKRWNMGHPGLGTATMHVASWGDFPPPRMPRIAHDAAGEHATVGAFKTGKYFAVAIAFIKSDGSYTQPLVPRKRRELSNLPGTPQAITGWKHGSWDQDDFGYYKVGGASTYVQGCRLYDIPIGPPDCTGRVIYRTAQAADMAAIDPATMGVWEVIRDNVTTELVSYKDDGELEVDPAVYRTDHKMCPRGKYVTTFKERVVVAHIKPSTVAFAVVPNVNTNILANNAGPATAKFNAIAYADLKYGFRILNAADGDAVANVTIELNIGVAGGAPTTTTLTVAAGSQATVEDVVDFFNANTTAANVVGGTVQAGVHFVLAPNFPAKTLASALRSTVTTDCGDTNLFSVAKTGQVRTFSAAFFGVAYVHPTRMGWEYEESRQRRALEFTGGGPLHAKYAANSFYVGNVRFVPEEAGDIVGIGAGEDGLVVTCANGVYTLMNTRDTNTNEDDDYNIREISKHLKFCAPDSVCEGAGWMVALSNLGLIAMNGQPGKYVVISDDVFDDTEKRGSLANEISACLNATSLRSYDSQRCTVSNAGNALFVSFRRTGDTNPTRDIVYAYGAGRNKQGIESLLDDNGQPFGWSTPCNYNQSFGGLGPVCSAVRTDAGVTLRRLFTFPAYVGGTGDGAIIELEAPQNGYLDAGATAYQSTYDFALAIADRDVDFCPQTFDVMFGHGAAGDANAYLRFILGEAMEVTGATYVLDSIGSGVNMRTLPFDVELLDKLHVPRLSAEIIKTGNSGLTVWGVRTVVSQHRRRT